MCTGLKIKKKSVISLEFLNCDSSINTWLDNVIVWDKYFCDDSDELHQEFEKNKPPGNMYSKVNLPFRLKLHPGSSLFPADIFLSYTLFLQCGVFVHDTTFGISHFATAAWQVAFLKSILGVFPRPQRPNNEHFIHMWSTNIHLFLCSADTCRIVRDDLTRSSYIQHLLTPHRDTTIFLKAEYLIRPYLPYSLSWRTVSANRNNAADRWLSHARLAYRVL